MKLKESKYFFFGIATLQVVTGSLNTITVALADEQIAENSVGEKTNFNHPFLQAAAMFLGEMLCFPAYFIVRCFKRPKSQEQDNVERDDKEENQVAHFRNPGQAYLLFVPAMCDMVATSLMYIGLTITSASSFQMFRGSLLVFTGLLTVFFLRRRLEWYKWLGMLVISGGLAVVGSGDLGGSDDAASKEINGDLLILGAQVVMAFQGVYEEKILVKYDINPLLAVGWEGIFGFTTLSLLLVPFGFIKVGSDWSHSPHGYLEDAIDGFTQLGNEPKLLGAFIGTIFSIGFFNFAGMMVTKEMSATTRVVLDSVRTLVIWVFSLAVAWEAFKWTSAVGFLVIIVGMFIYNDIVRPRIMRCINKEEDC